MRTDVMRIDAMAIGAMVIEVGTGVGGSDCRIRGSLWHS